MARKVKGFSRVDTGDAHGWLVRIKRGDVKRSKFLSDSTHGGKAKAKKAAEKVYKEWEAELPAPETAENKLGKRNTSGVVGVHYSHDVDARYPNCSYEYYIASWKNDDGRRQNVRFAISKFGKKVAFELACLAREMRTTDRDKVIAKYEKGGKKVNIKSAKKATKAAPKKKVAPKKKAPKKAAKKVVKKAAAKKKPAKKKAKKRK